MKHRKKNFMLLANSSLFVDKELDSAVESIRPFISVSKQRLFFNKFFVTALENMLFFVANNHTNLQITEER